MTKDVNANVLDKDRNLGEELFNENRKADKDVNANVKLDNKEVSANAKLVTKNVNSNVKLVDNDVNANVKLLAKDVNANAKLVAKDVNSNVKLVDNDVNANVKLLSKDVNANAKLVAKDVKLVDKDVNSNAKLVAKDVNANVKLVDKDVNANAKLVAKDVKANAKLVAKDVNANAKLVAKDVITNVKIVDKDGKAKVDDLMEMVRKYLESPTNSELTNKGIKSQEQNKENSPKIFNEIGKAGLKDRKYGKHSNPLQSNEKLRIHGTPLKIDNLEVSMEATAEMIGKDIAAKLSEPRIDMVVALVTVIGVEAAVRIFKETQEVELRGGLMVKNGARRRTPGGTFFQLVREIQDPNIDMEKVISVFGRFNNFEKMESDRVEKKEIDALDRPCDYFNDLGLCKFKSGHFSQSGFTRRIHSCRFCFYHHQVENSHPESQCKLYMSHLNNIGSLFLSKEGSSNRGQIDEVARQAEESAFGDKFQRSDLTRQAENSDFDNKLQGSDINRKGKASSFENKLQKNDVARQGNFENKLPGSYVPRQPKASALDKIMTGSNALPIGIRPSSLEGSSNKFITGDVTRQAKESALQNHPQRSLVTREAKVTTFGNKLQKNNVTRPANTFAMEKFMTGSNALPIGNRPRSTAGGTVEQENQSRDWSRSTINTFKAGTGSSSRAEKHLPSSNPASSADEISEINKVAQDVSKSKINVSGNGHQRSTKRNELQSYGGEKDMNKAKAKLSMLSDKISKSVVTGHQDYEDKKSMFPWKGDLMDSKQKVDCKVESHKGKEKKNRKGKCLDKMQAEEQHEEIFESKKDNTEDKEKKASVKKEDNPSLKDNKFAKFATKTSTKENYQGTKTGLFNGNDGQEKTQATAINENKKKSGFKFKEDNYPKSGNKFKEENNQSSGNKCKDDNNDKVNNQKAKPEIKISNSGNLFGKSKPVDQSPLDRFLNPSKRNGESFNRFAKKSEGNGESFNRFAKKSQGYEENFNRFARKSQGNEENFTGITETEENFIRFTKKSQGNGESFNRLVKKSEANHANGGNRKEALHCPCPPYCPSCLNKVKMGKSG